MRRGIYPGSFDPVTHGHLDVMERATRLFDEVLVAVARNSQKDALFSTEERMALLREAVAGLKKIKVVPLEGLLAKFAQEQEAQAVIRGLRAISDFEYEFQMALTNRKLAPEVETIFLMPREEYTYVSSRIIKEVASLGGQVSDFAPDCVCRALKKKFA